jgi:hypothetical protein
MVFTRQSMNQKKSARFAQFAQNAAPGKYFGGILQPSWPDGFRMTARKDKEKADPFPACGAGTQTARVSVRG